MLQNVAGISNNASRDGPLKPMLCWEKMLGSPGMGLDLPSYLRGRKGDAVVGGEEGESDS